MSRRRLAATSCAAAKATTTSARAPTTTPLSGRTGSDSLHLLWGRRPRLRRASVTTTWAAARARTSAWEARAPTGSRAARSAGTSAARRSPLQRGPTTGPITRLATAITATNRHAPAATVLSRAGGKRDRGSSCSGSSARRRSSRPRPPSASSSAAQAWPKGLAGLSTGATRSGSATCGG